MQKKSMKLKMDEDDEDPLRKKGPHTHTYACMVYKKNKREGGESMHTHAVRRTQSKGEAKPTQLTSDQPYESHLEGPTIPCQVAPVPQRNTDPPPQRQAATGANGTTTSRWLGQKKIPVFKTPRTARRHQRDRPPASWGRPFPLSAGTPQAPKGPTWGGLE